MFAESWEIVWDYWNGCVAVIVGREGDHLAVLFEIDVIQDASTHAL